MSTISSHSSAGATCFRHELLEHGGGTYGFVARTLPFIESALAAGEPVLVAVGRERIDALQEALNGSAACVQFVDIRQFGTNPARLIAFWQTFIDSQRDGRGALGIGEPAWPGRSAQELEECRRLELLLNLAFARGAGWRLLCPYDLDGLEDRVIEHARSAHPYLAGAFAERPNYGYADCSGARDALGGSLPAPTGQVLELAFAARDLAELRLAVAAWAASYGLELERIDELVLAVNELATNSVRHGGGAGTLRMWREHRELVCEVRDAGQISDPLAGRVCPASDRRSGRGLWIVNHVCDLMQIRSEHDGSAIRVHKLLDD